MALFILRVFITTAMVLLTAHLIPGLEIDDWSDAVYFGLILGVINAIVRPVLTLLSIPINILTLGLFSLVINAFTFWLAGELSYGVHIHSLWGAFWGGFAIWITGIFTNRLIWRKNKF